MISLYVHIPFCTKKCPYCHFFVVPSKQDAKDAFKKALLQEWKMRLPFFEKKEIISLYFGGGTPSLCPDVIEAITQEAQKLTIHSKIEITVEANPEQLFQDTIDRLKKAGVNRLSIGVQSFDDHLLTILGRTHSSKQAKKAICQTYSAGITNITIDLMNELPHQTMQSWEHTLEQAISLPISHLSLYNLTFENGTVFKKKEKTLRSSLPSEKKATMMLQKAVGYLEQNGLKRYEISAFAKPGYEAIHNTGYWTGRPFIGLGPSAFSFYQGKRFRNICHLKKYCDQLEKNEDPIDFEEQLPYPANQHELLAIHLRLKRGVDLSTFSLPQTANAPIEKLLKEGLLQQKGSILRLTEEGELFYDTVAERIIF